MIVGIAWTPKSPPEYVIGVDTVIRGLFTKLLKLSLWSLNKNSGLYTNF